MKQVEFTITAHDGQARAGRLRTGRTEVDTPVFMPVATQGTIKAAAFDRAYGQGYRLLLANAFHLSMNPGEEVIEEMGGLNSFTGWPHAFITDSGGFQVFSLAEIRELDDDGVTFQSPYDGSTRRFTPESVVEIERRLSPDIGMVLDECVSFPSPRPEAERACERTLEWARRSLESSTEGGPALFGIVQGATYRDLRLKCVERLSEMEFPGLAIGGLSVGEGPSVMREVLAYTAPAMPQEKPRYLMGVGTPEDIIESVMRGVDMFDCVMPTRNARGACAFTFKGKVRLRNARHRRDESPVEEGCDCWCCKSHSRGYIRHLFAAREATGPALLTIHNLRFYARLMERIRQAVRQGRIEAFRREFYENYRDSWEDAGEESPGNQ